MLYRCKSLRFNMSLSYFLSSTNMIYNSHISDFDSIKSFLLPISSKALMYSTFAVRSFSCVFIIVLKLFVVFHAFFFVNVFFFRLLKNFYITTTILLINLSQASSFAFLEFSLTTPFKFLFFTIIFSWIIDILFIGFLSFL